MGHGASSSRTRRLLGKYVVKHAGEIDCGEKRFGVRCNQEQACRRKNMQYGHNEWNTSSCLSWCNTLDQAVQDEDRDEVEKVRGDKPNPDVVFDVVLCGPEEN